MNSSLLQEYKIKLATVSNTNQVITLLKEVAQWLKNKQVDQWRYLLAGGDDEEISEAILNQYTYMILADNELIGTFTLSPVQSAWDKHIFGEDSICDSVYLHRLAVSPKYIGKGIGKSILQWIQTNAVSNTQLLLQLTKQ